MDLNGYYRTQGIIKYLENDLEASHTYMKKADKELKSAEKSEIDIYNQKENGLSS